MREIQLPVSLLLFTITGALAPGATGRISQSDNISLLRSIMSSDKINNADAQKPTNVEVYSQQLPAGMSNASEIASVLTGIPGIISVTAITDSKLVFVLDISPKGSDTKLQDPGPLEKQIQAWLRSLAAPKPALSSSSYSVDLPAGTGNAQDIATKLASAIPGVLNIIAVGNTRLLFMLDESPDRATPNKPRDIARLRAQITDLVNHLAVRYPVIYVVEIPLGVGKNSDVSTVLSKQLPGVINIAQAGSTRLAFSIDPSLDPSAVSDLENSIEKYVKALVEQQAPASPNTESYTVRLYYDHDPATAAAIINNAYPEVNAAAIAPDTVVLTETLAGGSWPASKRDPLQDARRTLARFDQPRPQISLDTWSIQVSTSRQSDMEDAGPEIEGIAKKYNDVISSSTSQGWQFLADQLQSPNFLDGSFGTYLTSRTLVPLGQACCYQTDPEDYNYVRPTPTQGYGLGYTTLFKPLSPNLVNMLVALAASAHPQSNADALINAIETGNSSTRITQSTDARSCQVRDDVGYQAYQFLQLECVRDVLDKQLFAPHGASTTSALGKFRAAIADFLFQYKMMVEYPDDFQPFLASGAGANMDAQLGPVVDAFTSDLDVFQRRISVDIEGGALFHRKHVSYAASGIVSVKVVAGNAASVQTTTLNYFDATPPTTLGDFASALKSNASQTSLPKILTSNMTTNEAMAALAAIQALTRTPVSAKIGKGLTVSATAYSLSGASGAEMDITVESNENGVELMTAATASTPSSQVVQSDDLASRVSDHKVSTRVRVNSLNLFKLSTMESVLARGKTPWKPIDPWLEIPVLGELVKVPRSPAITYHRSFIFINALVVPTAADLGTGIPIVADVVADSVHPGMFIGSHKLEQLGSVESVDRLRTYHQSLLAWFASQYVAADGSVKSVGAIPSLSDARSIR